jgi:hypothetical protein
MIANAMLKKGSSVHVGSAYTRSGEGSDHFGSYVCSLSLHFYKSLFLGLECHKATSLPLRWGSPSMNYNSFPPFSYNLCIC